MTWRFGPFVWPFIRMWQNWWRQTNEEYIHLYTLATTSLFTLLTKSQSYRTHCQLSLRCQPLSLFINSCSLACFLLWMASFTFLSCRPPVLARTFAESHFTWCPHTWAYSATTDLSVWAVFVCLWCSLICTSRFLWVSPFLPHRWRRIQHTG